MIARRSLLRAMFAAPAIVMASRLMPVKSVLGIVPRLPPDMAFVDDLSFIDGQWYVITGLDQLGRRQVLGFTMHPSPLLESKYAPYWQSIDSIEFVDPVRGASLYRNAGVIHPEAPDAPQSRLPDSDRIEPAHWLARDRKDSLR